MKKILALVLAMLMVAGMVSALAADPTYSITITPPEGVAADATNTYKIYKVFDATVSDAGISYKLCDGDTLSAAMTAAGFSVDSVGNVSGPEGEELSADAIAAIAAYVTEADLADTVTATGTAAVTANLTEPGYYYITTSTGTVVTIDSTTPTADVIDKNTVPEVDKKITGASSIDEDGKKALAQVGTTVNYSADITVGKGAKGYIFHDTMETGLAYNNDVKVYVGETEVAAADHFTVGQATGDTFTVTFLDTYMKTLEAGTKLTVKYSATVTEDAITTDPLNNTCYVSYGDANSNNRTPDSEADVYEAKISVIKNQPAKEGDEGAVLNEEDNKYYKPLAGAGFVLKNAQGKYYKITTTDGKDVVSWVDSINDATEYTSGSDGKLNGSFTGLANGTYTLVEKTVPSGYNQAADLDFTIAEHDYTAANLEQQAEVTNNAGAELPSTGGIGTTIFYVGGSILVLAAAILLITKRRMGNQD